MAKASPRRAPASRHDCTHLNSKRKSGLLSCISRRVFLPTARGRTGFQRFDELYKRFELRFRFQRFSLGRRAGARIFRQITSACSLPREGWCATSSHTWSTSQTGTPSFRTTARNTNSSFRGTRTYTSGSTSTVLAENPRCRWSTAQRPPGGILGGAACWERPSTEFFTQRRPLQQFGSGSRYSRRRRARQECWDASARNRSRLLLEATQAIRLASKRFPEKLQSGIVHQERTNMLTPTYHCKRLVGQAQPCCESKGLSGWS
jgi:hypothetical protein